MRRAETGDMEDNGNDIGSRCVVQYAGVQTRASPCVSELCSSKIAPHNVPRSGSPCRVERRQGSTHRSAMNMCDATPYISSYGMTRISSLECSLQWCMKHWNIPRTRACCPLHAHLAVAEAAIRSLNHGGCDPLWSPLLGWQCPECSCLNHSEVRWCDM